jgi:hypothetical protein
VVRRIMCSTFRKLRCDPTAHFTLGAANAEWLPRAADLGIESDRYRVALGVTLTQGRLVSCSHGTGSPACLACGGTDRTDKMR